MKRVAIAVLLLIPAAVFLGQAPASPPRAFIDQQCASCHNDTARVGGFSLSGADLGNVAANPELWEKVNHKIRTGQMPPPNRPRPEGAASKAMVSWLETSLDRAAAANPNPGRVGIHRLNRSEYANVVRDLLGLEI